jgi:hypothetical protein
MNDIWKDEYKKVLKNKPKNSWVVNMLGDLKEYEISVVHTSEPHGLISWGWVGLFKVVISDGGFYEIPKEHSKKIIQSLMKVAEETAIVLNMEFPRGIGQ